MFANSASILGAILGFALLAAPAGAAAVPSTEEVGQAAPQAVEARVWRSNIDVAQACREQHGNDWAAVVVNNGCGGWKCRRNDALGGVNMDAYCIARFGSGIYAACGGGTVWDWQCHDHN
jgi:hypothetical protein